VVGCATPNPPILAGRPECPHDWPFKREQIPEAQSTLDVPEFNDCQRFIVQTRQGLAYQALYAIFATDTLYGIQSAAANSGPLDEMGKMQSYIAPESALVVARIYAEGDYGPLGIESPMNCLFVFRDSVTDSLAAKMVPISSVDSSCLVVNYRTRPGTLLQVRRRAEKNFLGDTVPPVTRWDWDDATNRQYLGFGCAAAWCDVVGDDYGDTSPGMQGVVKGWYDQQFLAYFDPNGGVTPSRVRGTILPDSALRNLNNASDYEGQWRVVARVSLDTLPNTTGAAPSSQVLAQYKRHSNYDLTSPTGPFNRISLCMGDLYAGSGPAPIGTCPVPNLTQGLATCHKGGEFWAMVEPAKGGPAEYYCVMRRSAGPLYGPPPARELPATARWRWMAVDEGTWTECLAGCCEKLGPGG
jgi:hypothetical protein